jgi:hypothetical protein
MTNELLHLIDLRTSYRFSGNFPIRIEADVTLSGLNDRELNNSNGSKHSTYVVSYPLIRDQK